MSGVLERLGRFAARRPWVRDRQPGSAVCLLVRHLGGGVRARSSTTRSRHPASTRSRPPSCWRGPDSVERWASAPTSSSRRATPAVTFFDSPVAAGPTSPGSRTPSRRCPHVLRDERSRPARCAPAGRAAVESGVGLARRPGRPHPRSSTPSARTCRHGRPGEPQGVARRPPRTRRRCSIEAGGDLYFAFEQAPTGVGEALGLVVAIVILLLAFGSLVAMGLPIGTALCSASRSAPARCRWWPTSSTSPAGRP